MIDGLVYDLLWRNWTLELWLWSYRSLITHFHSIVLYKIQCIKWFNYKTIVENKNLQKVAIILAFPTLQNVSWKNLNFLHFTLCGELWRCHLEIVINKNCIIIISLIFFFCRLTKQEVKIESSLFHCARSFYVRYTCQLDYKIAQIPRYNQRLMIPVNSRLHHCVCRSDRAKILLI